MNGRTVSGCLLFAALSLIQTVSLAHEGHHPGAGDLSVRVWTISESGAHVNGSFVASLDGKVQVRRTDGNVVSLEIAELNGLDQKWIERKVARVRMTNG